MISRVHQPNPALGNPTMRMIEPSDDPSTIVKGHCEAAHTGDAGSAAVTFAEANRVMESARRMVLIHQGTFRKLAE